MMVRTWSRSRIEIRWYEVGVLAKVAMGHLRAFWRYTILRRPKPPCLLEVED